MSLPPHAEELLSQLRQVLESNEVLRKSLDEALRVQEAQAARIRQLETQVAGVTRHLSESNADTSARALNAEQEAERLRLALQDAERRVSTGLEAQHDLHARLASTTSSRDIDKALDRAGIPHAKLIGEPDPAAHVAGEARGAPKPCPRKDCMLGNGHAGACADAFGRVTLVRRTCPHGVDAGSRCVLWCGVVHSDP